MDAAAWSPPETEPPPDGPLLDTFGRIADDLRVSVVDRCNFRCVYCMPADGLAWLPREELLTYEEISPIAPGAPSAKAYVEAGWGSPSAGTRGWTASMAASRSALGTTLARSQA